MPKHYAILPSIVINTELPFFHPAPFPSVLHLEDDALLAMLDLRNTAVMTATKFKLIDKAFAEMTFHGTHLCLIIDDNQKVLGLVSAEDILSQKPLMITQNMQIPYSEITAGMIMTPTHKVAAFKLHDLRFAKMGHLIHTLHYLQQHYAFVIETEPNTQNQTLCGLFSMYDISKAIGEDIISDISEARSVLQLKKDLG